MKNKGFLNMQRTLLNSAKRLLFYFTYDDLVSLKSKYARLNRLQIFA